MIEIISRAASQGTGGWGGAGEWIWNAGGEWIWHSAVGGVQWLGAVWQWL